MMTLCAYDNLCRTRKTYESCMRTCCAFLRGILTVTAALKQFSPLNMVNWLNNHWIAKICYGFLFRCIGLLFRVNGIYLTSLKQFFVFPMVA